RAPALENNDRLGSRGVAEGLTEASAVLNAFDVGADHVSLGVPSKVSKQLTLVDVGSVAVRDDFREADAAHGRCVYHLAGVAAALRDEADRPALRGKAWHEGELRFGHVEPHAVRAEDANAGPRETADDLRFEV